jgi:hypothetical protein
VQLTAWLFLSVRRCVAVHSVTTRRLPLKPAARRRRHSSAQILFDPTGPGGGSQVALLLNDGALATQIQASLIPQHAT